MKAYVYILKSIKYNHYYTGQTNDFRQRLKLHNSGKVKWTKRYKPWKLIYVEKYTDKKSAVRRKKYLKSHAGRKWLKNKYHGPVAQW